jgi:glycosyltransferase involved in cell wall biosynthesis
MRIAMIGKYPPIEGGVSMHQYWYAHALAALGHEIHVITNAKEVESPFRMLMRHQDWEQCEKEYAGGGSVQVHWTDPYDRSQRHIPWHNPYVTKLASLATQTIEEHDLQVIFSYYLEPYGVAGHLTAEMTNRPHVVKHAGSDVGLLLHHAQMGTLYDHVFRKAARIVTGGAMAERLSGQFGLPRAQLFLGDDFRVPESLFCPDGEALNLEKLASELEEDNAFARALDRFGPVDGPFLGVYGKLGEAKGSFDLLHAVKRVRDRGQKFTLLVVGHGFTLTENRFHQTLAELDLARSVIQLPFLPHWRVPPFLRMCQAVCFLERDFPITFHAPTVPREVFACARCLIASAEVLQRQVLPERLVHGFNCLAVRDVRDTDELAGVISSALDDPNRANLVGRRGYEYSLMTERLRVFPANYERLFGDVIEPRSNAFRSIPNESAVGDRFMWARQIIGSLPPDAHRELLNCTLSCNGDEDWALTAYAALLELVEKGSLERSVLLDAMRLELRLAGLFSAINVVGGLFRLNAQSLPLSDEELPELCPIRVQGLEVDEYDYDIREMLAARNRGELPLWVPRQRSRAAVLPTPNARGCRIFWLSPAVESLLEVCDGTQTIRELNATFNTVSRDITEPVIDCFRLGLLSLVAGHPRPGQPP